MTATTPATNHPWRKPFIVAPPARDDEDDLSPWQAANPPAMPVPERASKYPAPTYPRDWWAKLKRKEVRL